MLRCISFVFLCLASTLFADNEWDDYDRDDDDRNGFVSDSGWDADEWDGFGGSNLISYGGMSFRCDYGCGDLDSDSDMQQIHSLFTECLNETISSQHGVGYGLRDQFGAWHYLLPWGSDDDDEYYFAYDWKKTDGLFDAVHYRSGPDELYDGGFDRYHLVEVSIFNHDDFLRASALFRQDLSFYQQEQIRYLQKEIERSKKNITTLNQLAKTEGVACLDESGSVVSPNFEDCVSIVRIRQQLISEEDRIIQNERDLKKNDEEHNVHWQIAAEKFQKIDALFKRIFTWCLENHQPEGIAFHAALEDFLAGDLDDALDQMRFLINRAESDHWGNELIAKLCFLHGQIENELCLYADAIIDLTRSIQKNPESKEVYFERARAYFETGQFEQALQDFLVADIKSTPIDPADVSLLGFASGFMLGTPTGAIEGVTEFIPSLLTSLKTISSGIWSLAQDPVGVSSEFAHASLELLQSIRSSRDVLGIFIPELKDLITNWDQLSSFQQGKSFGHIVGKYGTDILLTLGTARGVKAYTDLRRASALQTFEAYTKSERNAAHISKVTRDYQLKREPCQHLEKAVSDWLGEGTRLIRNRTGDPVFLSKDGIRKVRFDFNRPFPHENPHLHVEELVNGQWKEAHRIFPIDVPRK